MSEEKLLELEKALEILEEAIDAIDKLPIKEYWTTGYNNIYEDEEIIGKEVEIVLCSNVGLSLKLSGWVEIDRRYTQNPEEECRVFFKGVVAIPELDIKFGGGHNNDYRLICMDYDIKNKKWGEFYEDSL